MKWKTLQHNGILFPPAFETKKIGITVRGEKVNLNLLQEEMIYQWAKKKDTPYAQDNVFQKNFTADFEKTLNSKFKGIKYEDIDFSEAYKLVDKEKDLKSCSNFNPNFKYRARESKKWNLRVVNGEQRRFWKVIDHLVT